jgi:hypothetical protein
VASRAAECRIDRERPHIGQADCVTASCTMLRALPSQLLFAQWARDFLHGKRLVRRAHAAHRGTTEQFCFGPLQGAGGILRNSELDFVEVCVSSCFPGAVTLEGFFQACARTSSKRVPGRLRSVLPGFLEACRWATQRCGLHLERRPTVLGQAQMHAFLPVAVPAGAQSR